MVVFIISVSSPQGFTVQCFLARFFCVNHADFNWRFEITYIAENNFESVGFSDSILTLQSFSLCLDTTVCKLRKEN